MTETNKQKLTHSGHSRPVTSSEPKKGRPRHRTGRVSQDDWFSAGLELLTSGGLGSVQVERLAKILEVSRSGFYWHFGSRDEFLQAIKRYWANEFTRGIIEKCEAESLPPREKLLRVSHIIRESRADKFDLALWHWANEDPEVSELAKQVTKQRTDYIRSLIQALGFQDAELEARTRMFVVYHSWGSTMFNTEVLGQDGALTDRIVGLIAGISDQTDTV
ncbi:TetR/AcrR family transcriptional regulator [Ruegeria arenilitoris]|uniref:TetR/AcrR family transcriptional regulator n=1 Tax=Ruegeria arenilitoris TaxID=1173585 RepID=UPI00147995AE